MNIVWAVYAIGVDDFMDVTKHIETEIIFWIASEAIPTIMLLITTRSKERPLFDPDRFLASNPEEGDTEAHGSPIATDSNSTFRQGYGWPMPFRLHQVSFFFFGQKK